MAIKVKVPAQQPAIDFDKVWIQKFCFEHLSPAEHRLEMVGMPYGTDGDGNVVRAKQKIKVETQNLRKSLAKALVAAGLATSLADAGTKLAAAKTQMKTWRASGTVTPYHLIVAFEMFQETLFTQLTDEEMEVV